MSLELGDTPVVDFENIVANVFGEDVDLIQNEVQEITINHQVFTMAREFGEIYIVSRTADGDEILRKILQSLTDSESV